MVNRGDFGPFIVMAERISQLIKRFSNEFVVISAGAMISAFASRLCTVIRLDAAYSLLSKFSPLITNFQFKFAAFNF